MGVGGGKWGGGRRVRLGKIVYQQNDSNWHRLRRSRPLHSNRWEVTAPQASAFCFNDSLLFGLFVVDHLDVCVAVVHAVARAPCWWRSRLSVNSGNMTQFEELICLRQSVVLRRNRTGLPQLASFSSSSLAFYSLPPPPPTNPVIFDCMTEF